MDTQNDREKILQLRLLFKRNSRMKLEFLADLSRLLREHHENIDDDLLSHIVVAIPEELPGESYDHPAGIDPSGRPARDIPPQPAPSRIPPQPPSATIPPQPPPLSTIPPQNAPKPIPPQTAGKLIPPQTSVDKKGKDAPQTSKQKSGTGGAKAGSSSPTRQERKKGSKR